MAHAPQTRRPVGAENGFCLNIHLLWDAPDVSAVGLTKGSSQFYTSLKYK